MSLWTEIAKGIDGPARDAVADELTLAVEKLVDDACHACLDCEPEELMCPRHDAYDDGAWDLANALAGDDLR